MKSLWALLLAAACACAHAHKPSDSYLALRHEGGEVRGQWDIALRDLEYAIGLDANGDGALTWGEVRGKRAEIAAYALARLKLQARGETCAAEPGELLLDQHSDGAYAVLRFVARCAASAPESLAVDYSLFFDLDPTHRGLLRLGAPEKAVTAVLGPDRPRLEWRLEGRSTFGQFLDYAREGVWHIWIGFDHVLFLLSLLLPSVVGARRFPPVFWDVVRVVTAFTLAHSITLALAALSVIALPSRLVESAIALSVVLAALNNLWPLVRERRWLVAFGFGLIHGFGFASVLADLGLPRDALVLALFGFNVGVEGGQLAIVLAFLPLAYAVRNGWAYRRVVFAGGSAAIALVAALWLVERAFDVNLGLI
jgi:hypothetical protein